MAEKILLDQQAENQLKRYSAELKVQRQELLEKLKITLSSSKKLEILRKIDQIEDEIKRDQESLMYRKKIIERENSKLRKAEGRKQTNQLSPTNLGEGLGWMGGGALAGAGISSTIGNIGLVGGFGGISLGLGTMVGTGAIIGSATYGAFKSIEEGDTTALSAVGLGAVSGAGVSAAVGGMGLSVGGTAFGVGLGAMAMAGGVVGLGIYGFTKMLSQPSSQAQLWHNLLWLKEITREYEEKIMWDEIEVESELQSLKTTVKEESVTQILADLKKAKAAVAMSSFIPLSRDTQAKLST